MLFNSIEYIFLFLPMVFILYFFLNKIKLYNIAKIFLLLASLYFYGSYKIEYVPILISLILFNYFISYLFKKPLSEKNKKIILISGISGNILILLFFKYFNFLIEEFKLLNFADYNSMKIILPLGISFFTLQQISYIVDCYREKVKNYNLLDYSLFICFFPQLIAGPIVRHQEMIPQFQDLSRRVVDQKNIFIGIFLITIGLFKKIVFADNFISFLDFMDSSHMYNDIFMVWIMGISKLLQVYFDFSGYCDIAMGSAFLFNISLPWNFNSPFQATNLLDYWKRWHMTFVRFLKDYIYKPLNNKIDNKGLKALNILFVFTIIGVWAGSNILHIFYGITNGIFIIINKLWKKLNIKLNKIISQFITFISLIISIQFTQISSFNDICTVFKTMFGIDAIMTGFTIQNYDLVFSLLPPHNARINFVILILSLIIVFYSKNSAELARYYVKQNKTIYTVILAILFIIAVMSITKSNDFIYFVF